MLVEFSLTQFAIMGVKEFSFGSNCRSHQLPWGCFYQLWKQVLPFISCLQEDWADLSVLCIGTPSHLPLRHLQFQEHLSPAAACPASRLCHLRQKRLHSVTCYSNMHPLHLFFSLTFFFAWPELILSLSASHLDQIPLQLSFLFWPRICQPPKGLCKSQGLKTTLSVPGPTGSQRTKESELLSKETAPLRVPLLRMPLRVCGNLSLSIN